MRKRFLTPFVLASLLCSAASAKAQQEEWLLVQNSQDFGSHSFYVSHDAIRAVNKGSGYIFVCKAPDWEVHCFRPTEKVEWVGHLPLFSGRLIANPFGDPEKNGSKTTYLRKTRQAGLSCSLYFTGPLPKSCVVGADDIQIAPQVADFLSRFYDIPDCGKVPIYRLYDKGRGSPYRGKERGFASFDQGQDLRSGPQIELKTQSARKIPFNAKDFVIPKGFKRLAQLTSVAYSPNQKDAVKETLEDVGFSSEQGRKK